MIGKDVADVYIDTCKGPPLGTNCGITGIVSGVIVNACIIQARRHT